MNLKKNTIYTVGIQRNILYNIYIYARANF